MTKHGLGRGLDALFGDAEPIAEEERTSPQKPRDEVLTLPLSKIDVCRAQPRKAFDEALLSELADSIRSVGVLQPILVAPVDGRYQIVAGERRFRAARMAGLSEIPAIVRDFDEIRRMEAALIENLQRTDLNPVEEALGIQNLMDRCGLTQETVSVRLGKSRSAVANLLRLLNLPDEILDMLIEGTLSAGHARALVPLPKERQMKLAKLAVEQGYSVRQLERLAALPEPVEKAKPAPPSPEIRRLERMAKEVFGIRAKVEGDQQKGKIVLSYEKAEELQHIWELLSQMGGGER